MELTDLLLNLNTALLTLVIGIYALANSLLGTQIKRNMLFIERRLKETQNEILNLTNQGASKNLIEEIQQRIDKHKEEQSEIKTILKSLTLKWAVLVPCLCYGLVYVVYLYHEVITLIFIRYEFGTFDLQISMILLMAIGTYMLYQTLKSIEFATLNVPLPHFTLTFATEETTIELAQGTRMGLSLFLYNDGYKMGEMIELSLFFPPTFTVHHSPQYQMNPQGARHTLPNCTGVFIEFDNLHIDTEVEVTIDISTPSIIDDYIIPSFVNEKEITQEEFELSITTT